MTGFENGQDAYKTVPFGKSIACSTPEAVAWDPEWEKSVGDISGRAVAVHDSSQGFDLGKDSSYAASVSSSSDGGNVTSTSARATTTTSTVTVAALSNNAALLRSRQARHSRRLPGKRASLLRSSQARFATSSSAYAFV